MGRLAGKVAVVTGSGQGIGRAIARLMAAEGAAVVTNSRSAVSRDQTTTAADTAREIEEVGGTARAVFADVGTMDGARQVVGTALDEFGRVDILVNNAGGAGPAPIDDLSEELWDSVVGGNLKSQYACTVLALPAMRAQGWGRIVNVGSNIGLYGMPIFAAYAAAKGGTLAFTFTLAQELAGTGITANCLVPTATTVRNERARAERERLTGHVLQTSATRVPEAIAPVAVYLASDAAGEITGQVVYSAGGQVTLYSWPPPAKSVLKEGLWSVDELERVFPAYFGAHLEPVRVPKPLG